MRAPTQILSVAVTISFIGNLAWSNTLLFETGFETGQLSVSGSGNTAGVGRFEGVGNISGNFWHNKAIGTPSTVSLSDLETHTSLTVQFDLLIIDSWDGLRSKVGADYFDVRVDGDRVFRGSFDVFGNPSSVPRTAKSLTGPVNRVGSHWPDRGYSVDFTVPHFKSNALIEFLRGGPGAQPGYDESFGLDNISISSNAEPAVPLPPEPVAPVPLPASASGLLIAIGLTAWRFRRQKQD